MSNQVSVENWIAMFREAGLDDATMKQWHRVFESHNPAGHQNFLEWLGLANEQIDAIRAQAR